MKMKERRKWDAVGFKLNKKKHTNILLHVRNKI